MSWASRRQFTYLGSALVLVVLGVGIPLFFALHEEPTCSDGIHNGDELGVDCGGSCALVCSFQAVDPLIRWSRFFEITNNVFTAVAYVENPNADVAAFDVPYTFKLRDANNVLILERKGVVALPPKGAVPIFETGIMTGSREPRRVEFEFNAKPNWIRSAPYEPEVRIVRRTLSDVETAPRLRATIENTSLDDYMNVGLVALLFDATGNVVHVSKTRVDYLEGQQTADIVFTWPEPFSAPVARIEILPMTAPFN